MISVYIGFQSTLTQWISRYISIYPWLPVSDLHQQRAGTYTNADAPKDIQELSDPEFHPDGAAIVYVIFMIIVVN